MGQTLGNVFLCASDRGTQTPLCFPPDTKDLLWPLSECSPLNGAHKAK